MSETTPQTREEKLQSIFDECGPDAPYVWDIHTRNPNGTSGAFVLRVDGDTYDVADLQRRIPAGRYEARLRVVSGKYRSKPQLYVELFEIAARPVMPAEPAPAADVADTGIAAVRAQVNDLSAALAKLVERMTAPPPPPPPPAETITAKDMLQMLLPLIAQRDTMTLKDVVPLLQQRTPAGELAELMQTVKKLAPGSSGSDDGESLASIAKAVVSFLPAPTQAPAAPAAVQQPPAALQAATPAQGQPAASPPTPAGSPAPAPATRRKLPFPGADVVAGYLVNNLAAIPHIGPDALLEAAGTLDVEIEQAGGNPAEIAERYDAVGLVGALIGYEPRLEPIRPQLQVIADAWAVEWEDGPQPDAQP